ncbi:MGA_1079 family surface serine endopeptidase, partial [Mesomycoplasma ovipneumoniae]
AKPLPKKPNLDNQNNLSSDKKEEQNKSTSRRDNEQIKTKTEDKIEEENQKSEEDIKNTSNSGKRTDESSKIDINIDSGSLKNTTGATENNTNSKTSKKTSLTLFEQQQQDSIEKISKHSTISSSFKHFFAEQVSEQKSTQDLKKLEEKFNKISNLSAKLKEIIESANFVKTTSKYTSTTNNVDKLLDITLLKAQSFFHNNQLAFSDNIDNLEVQINGTQNEIIRLQNELNGNTSEENIKNIEQAINDVNPSYDDEKISTYELQDKLNPAAFDVETTKLLTKIEKEGYT